MGEEFFERLCRENQEKLKKFVYRLTNGDKYLTDEIIQETYLYAVENKEKLISHPNPTAWFYKSAQIYYKRLTAKNNKIKINEESLENISEAQNDPGLSYEEFNDEGGIDYILSELPEKDRELISLHYEQGYSLQEIADMWKLSYITVRRYHAKMLKTIKKFFEKIEKNEK